MSTSLRVGWQRTSRRTLWLPEPARPLRHAADHLFRAIFLATVSLFSSQHPIALFLSLRRGPSKKTGRREVVKKETQKSVAARRRHRAGSVFGVSHLFFFCFSVGHPFGARRPLCAPKKKKRKDKKACWHKRARAQKQRLSFFVRPKKSNGKEKIRGNGTLLYSFISFFCCCFCAPAESTDRAICAAVKQKKALGDRAEHEDQDGYGDMGRAVYPSTTNLSPP